MALLVMLQLLLNNIRVPVISSAVTLKINNEHELGLVEVEGTERRRPLCFKLQAHVDGERALLFHKEWSTDLKWEPEQGLAIMNSFPEGNTHSC